MPEPVRIGDAELYLGDCLEILPTLGPVDAVVTDPMYGVGLEYAEIDDTEENVRAVMVPAIEMCIARFGRVVVTPGTRCMWLYPRPDETGAVYFPAGAGFSRWGFTCFQPILYYGKDPHPSNNKKPNSIQCTEMSEKNGHPCPKPEKWMAWMVNRASLPGECVLDPFMGSGTTGVACARLGRKFIGIEIEPKYFDIACKRIEREYEQLKLFPPEEKRATVQLELEDGKAAAAGRD
jgi:site-specific DNA-methyltransferase (adenine-specific)/modification methylase